MQRVVITGGGIAGIVTATHLARKLRRANAAEVLVVDQNLAHVWKPMLHTFAAGTANVNRKGQIEVRPTLQTREDDSIFAVGDCALRGSGWQVASHHRPGGAAQAVFLASSLAHHLTKNKPLSEFKFRDMGSLVALGDYGAAYGSLGQHGFLHGAQFKGWLAKIGHASLYFMHQLDLNGFVKTGVGWLADDLTRLARPRIGLN